MLDEEHRGSVEKKVVKSAIIISEDFSICARRQHYKKPVVLIPIIDTIVSFLYFTFLDNFLYAHKTLFFVGNE